MKNNLRKLPKSIGKRISDLLSSAKEIFQKGNTNIFWSMDKSGFTELLVFTPKANAKDNTSKKQRKRKIICFFFH